MVLGFTYSTVIHSELVLAYGVTSGLIVPLLLKKKIWIPNIQLLQYYLLESILSPFLH